MACMAVKSPQATIFVKLKDGRKVSVSRCGDEEGHPVLFMHPLQGNRLMAFTFDETAKRLGLQIVTYDRPSIGRSCPSPYRQVSHAISDIVEICEQLQLQKFSILAMSAGTQYALACTLAPELKNRIVGKVTVLSPWVPISSRKVPQKSLVQQFASLVPGPLLAAGLGFTNGLVSSQVHKQKPVVQLMTRSSEREKLAFAADPNNEVVYSEMIKEWDSQGGSGFAQEMQICLEARQRLHYSYLEDVTWPVRVYAGTADVVLAYQVVQEWAEQAKAKNVEVEGIEDGTHDGIVHTHKGAILEWIAADVAAAGLDVKRA